MELEFFGATREVTGSRHILRVAGKTVLLDCGMFQGRRQESREKNLRIPVRVEQIDAVVLSHAHIDHAGRLPLLVREGYRRVVFCTPATRDLCAVMLADSAHIAEKDAEYLARHMKSFVAPLYRQPDVAELMKHVVAVPYNEPWEVVPGVRATFVDAGHILGSAAVVLECTENGRTTRLVFSADVGRRGLPIIRDAQPPAGADVPIYIDNPLAIDATTVFVMHPDAFDRGEDLVNAVRDLFHFDLVHYTRDVTESKALNAQRTPMVIIAASGMAESGRILHHLTHGASDSRNTILIVGFQAEHTLGRRIVERRPTLSILGDDVPLHARVEVLNGYSAHADRRELAARLDAVRAGGTKAPPVWLVHGEPPSQARSLPACAVPATGWRCRPLATARPCESP